MTQYIDKAAVVAEIERRLVAYQKNFDNADNRIARMSTNSRISGLKSILKYIDILEVKEVEVDFEKELDSMITPELKFHKALPSLFDIAKHFFELGIKAAQKGE